MADKIFGIDKGIIRAFLLMVVVVGILTTFFLSEYVSTILLGSIFYTATNGTTYTNTAVIGESLVAHNVTAQQLTNYPVVSGTLTLTNSSGFEYGLGNFTIVYANGSVIVSDTGVVNGTALLADYTYTTETTSNLPITGDTNTFLNTAEDDFITTFGYVNTGVKFAAALITVVAVILVFASFLPKRGKKEKLGY